MQRQKILVVDDDARLSDLVAGYLGRAGYEAVLAGDGPAALSRLAGGGISLMVLDLMMPGMDGLEVCVRARKLTDIPIIILSARDDERDRLGALGLGADDYMTKPFSMNELMARIRASLRRYNGELRRDAPVRAGGLVVDRASFSASVDGRPVQLTPTEFSILEALASAPGRVFTRMQLIEKAQGCAFEGYERTVDSHVRNLRRKIEEDPARPRYILTVYGAGYKFGGGK
ncbi:MAG: response regulator transcription factor [Succinivibrio sp.]